MSIALYRRYRPDTFQDVIGQDHVVKPLMAALRSGRISHAYLFSGPRGCGKTTSARIMARCLNCAEGPTDTPCGKCESCKDLATGGSGSLDVVEIDAASHNGVDDARELRERAGFAPVRDRYKIFILDEAHMVTQQGFNALLKIVEEPPEHVKFIFATTEPDKVIGTIRSRTHHYPFRLVPPEIMEKYMAKLCQAENIEPAPGVLQLVMRAGAGSVRDSLSVLDQLMAGAEDGKLAYGTASALLGYTDSSILERSVDAIIDRDGAALFEVIAKMIEGGHDPRRYLEDLLLRLRDLLVLSVSSPEDAQVALAGTPEDQLAVMNAQAQRWGTVGISHASDLTNTALTELTGATAPRLQVELLAARLLLPPESPVATASGQVSSSGSLSGPEAAMAALHRSGRPHSSQSPRVPEANRAVPSGSAPRPISSEESGVKSALSAPPANAPAIAPRSSAPELTAPRPAASPEKQVASGVAAPSVQSPETGNSSENQGEVSAAAPKGNSQTQAASEVEKGEQYWQVLQAWGKVTNRLNEVDSRLWSTCNRHLQIGGAQDQKLTLLADSPQTVEYLKDKLAPLEKCLAGELSGTWKVKLLAGSNDSFAPALSEVLSQVKLLLPPENAPGIENEAPPEEDFYPPEPEDLGAGDGEETSAPTDSAAPTQSSETTATPEAPTPKSADKATKEVNQVADSDSFASSSDSWIIDQTAPPSDKETPKIPAAINPQPQAAPEVAAPRTHEEIAAPRPGEEMVAPRPGSPQMPEAAPRAEVNETLAAPRAGNEPFAAPRPQENTAQENDTASEPSAAPEIAEDLPDMSDPDVGVDDSGGRWGVEVAKSLLGGKIVETADSDSPSN